MEDLKWLHTVNPAMWHFGTGNLWRQTHQVVERERYMGGAQRIWVLKLLYDGYKSCLSASEENLCHDLENVYQEAM